MPGVPYTFNNAASPETDYNIDADKVNANFTSLQNGSAIDDLAIGARLLSYEVPNSVVFQGAFAAFGHLPTTLSGFSVVGSFAVAGSTLNPGSGIIGETWCLAESEVAVPALALNATNYVWLVKREGGPYEPSLAWYVEVSQTILDSNRAMLYEVVCDGVGVVSTVSHLCECV